MANWTKPKTMQSNRTSVLQKWLRATRDPQFMLPVLLINFLELNRKRNSTCWRMHRIIPCG